jgi:inner membrane protein
MAINSKGPQAGRLTSSLGFKAAIIGALFVLFLIPINLIQGILSDREHNLSAAQQDIGEKMGGATTIGIAYLAVPVSYQEEIVYKNITSYETRHQTIFVMPETAFVNATSRAELRSRGIYHVPCYDVDASLNLGFSLSLPEIGIPDAAVAWDQARLVVEFKDSRSLRGTPELVNKGGNVAMRSERDSLGFYPKAVSAAVALVPKRAGGPIYVCNQEIRLALCGAESLDFFPIGEQTNIHLEGDWASPSFSGYALPSQRSMTAKGFSVDWFSDDSSRPFSKIPAAMSKDSDSYLYQNCLFGVDFMLPNDVYSLNHRSLRYALLFIIIPFAALFLFEITRRVRVHPIQYVLIGLADLIFYLLLLSMSELLSFFWAYAIAAAMVTVLISVYSAKIFGKARHGLVMAPILGAQYLYLFFALQSEDYALLIGSIGLFALVAAVMFVTRKVDWYRGGARKKGEDELATPTLPPIVDQTTI